MIRETMTRAERIIAAINLTPYDRVPVAPHLNAEYPMVHKGKTTADAYDIHRQEEGFQATLDLFDETGGWDGATLAGHAMPYAADALALYRGRGDLAGFQYPGRSKMIESSSSPQYAETPIIGFEDYDTIINLGWRGFLAKTAIERGTFPGKETLAVTATYLTDRYKRFVTAWKQRGVPVMAGFMTIDPQMNLSLLRTLPQFTLDMYRHPDKTQAVMEAMVDDMTEDALNAQAAAGPVPPTGIPGIIISCERGSGQYLSLKHFERFVWPNMKKMVIRWTEAGYVVTIHLDTNWTRNLPYFLELPKGKCICMLDSTSDIVKARDILDGHMCIMGDIPPSLSSHGMPVEMETYCKNLIDQVGKTTGLIISTGCAVPPDTRDENYLAMLNTARNYYPYSV